MHATPNSTRKHQPTLSFTPSARTIITPALALVLAAGQALASEPGNDTSAAPSIVTGSAAGAVYSAALEARPVCPDCSDDPDFDDDDQAYGDTWVGVFNASGVLLDADIDEVWDVPATQNPRSFKVTGLSDRNFDGRADGSTNGHGLLGLVELTVDYLDADYDYIDWDDRSFTFTTGMEVWLGSFVPPAGTRYVDVYTYVEYDDQWEDCAGSDIDHVEFRGLAPNTSYEVRLFGLVDGGLLGFSNTWQINAEATDFDQSVQVLTLMSDASGTLRVAVTGAGDADGDGLDDWDDCPHQIVGAYTLDVRAAAGTPCQPADLASPFGTLDFFDLVAFVGALSAQDPIADFAPPFGVFDYFDLVAFVGAFEQGCPPIALPAAPGSVGLSLPGGSMVRVSWSDQSNNEDFFEVTLRDQQGNIERRSAVPAGSQSVTFDLGSALGAGLSLIADVCAVNDAGRACASAATTVLGCGNAPSPATWTYRRPGSIRLNWIDNCALERAWRVAQARGNATNFRNIAVQDANATSTVLSHLKPGQTYRFKVRGRLDAGFTPYSNEVIVHVPAAPPAAPSNARIGNRWARAIDLCFDDNAGNELETRIAISTDGINFNNLAVLAPSGNASRCYRASDLQPNKTYWFKVRHANLAGYSAYSNTVQVTTRDEPPAAPSDLRLVDANPCSLQVRWNDNANNETIVRVAVSTDGVNFNNVGGDLPANTTAFTIPNRCPSTTYWIKVRMENAEGFSEYSNVIVATTQPLRTPTGLVASRDSSTPAIDVVITWNPPEGCHDQVRLARSIDGTNWNNIAVLDPGSTSFRDLNVVAGRTYHYKVRTRLNCDGVNHYSEYSNEDTARP